MKSKYRHFYKAMLAKVLAAVMVVLSIAVTPLHYAQAAPVPKLTKDKISILVGKKYDLNIKNEISNSSSRWSASDEKIATVTQMGVVTGVRKGTATITCKITAPKKVYILTCKVTVSEAKSNKPTPKPTQKPKPTCTPKPTSTPIPTNTPTPTLTPIPTPIPEFTDLNQSEIVAELGAGWNLGNQLEAVVNGFPGETNWGNPVITEDLIKAVKAAGFQSIRIPVSYFNYIGAAPNYQVDPTWLDRIQEVVDYCVNNDMYAIINMHGDGYNTIEGSWLLCNGQDQETIKAKYRAVWSQIAERFKYYDEHLIFESMNEEFDGNYNSPVAEYYNNINAYNQIFIDTVRLSGGYNDMRWVLVPGWNTDITYTAGNYGFVIPTEHYLSEDIPEGEKRIMISVHYYAPWDFCGGESGEITQWGESATDSTRVSTHSGQSYMAAQFKLLNTSFTSKGYPVVVGEYGSIDKSEFDPASTYYRAYYARKLCENSVKNGCIPMIWDNGFNGRYGFAYFDRSAATVTQPEIIAAIMEIYHGSTETGTATGIALDQSELNMTIGDAAVTLHASLTPADSTDKISWSSSDETVATISDSGIVRAYTLGTTVITALANGHTAQCTVQVKESQNVTVALYALETQSWSTIKSPSNAQISTNGGTFTLSLTGSQNMLSNIGSLYIKDLQVQSGVATESIVSNAKIKIEAVKFNGVNCTVIQQQPEEAVNQSSHALDFPILNQWADGSEKISEAIKNAAGSYQLTAAPYQESNTIEVTFTISEVVMSNVTPTPTPSPTPTPDPGTVTATPITSIKYDFAISGVNTETSLTFVNQTSNWSNGSADMTMNGNGDYFVTIILDNAAGMVNMGYFNPISGSTITAALTKITVNGAYELNYTANLDVGSSTANGLNNIWNTAAGTKIAEGTNGYIELNNDKTAFLFYVK
jgi:hypothetical protein